MEVQCLSCGVVLDGLIPNIGGILSQFMLIVGLQGLPLQVKI